MHKLSVIAAALLCLFSAGIATAEMVPGSTVQETGTAPDMGGFFIADFEGWPNNVGGEIGVYGSLSPNWDDVATVPYSWVYDPITPGYDPANVHSGKQSFRLVNGLGLNSELTWGSFAMDMGPTTDLTTMPKKVESLDASGYKYLSFWVKGAQGGEKMAMQFRDKNSLSYMPQATYNNVAPATAEWQKVSIPLSEVKSVDFSALDMVGMGFGKDVGNMKGEIVYIDDFAFSNNP